jgi:hypothetical protein
MRPLRRNQSTMPREDRVRSHDGGNLLEHPPAEWTPLRRQAPSLIIGKAEAAPSGLKLFLEDSVFLY